MSTAAALQLASITRRFERRWVLRGVSLRVEPGEALALLGRNGSGKSTLLRIIATLLRPTTGEGTVFGRDLLRDADAVRAAVGMLGHQNALYDDLTAAENLRFALRMMGRPADERTVAAALEEVGLGREAGERVRAFSAGMQRRLALARLLLRAPRLLLLDEPYSSFDADGVARMNAFIATVCAGGGAALVVTHDLARARPVAGRVMRLEGGRLRPAEDAGATAEASLADVQEGCLA